MTFSKKLKDYIKKFEINYADLAAEAGISTSAVSRYCSGRREPSYDSIQITKLAHGLCEIARKRGVQLDEKELAFELSQSVSDALPVSYEIWLSNLNTLLKVLDIRVAMLARALSYDPSHISKILAHQRRPGDINRFTDEICFFIADNYTRPEDVDIISNLIGQPRDILSSPSVMHATLIEWLGSNKNKADNDILDSFLRRLDIFDIDSFLSGISEEDCRTRTLNPDTDYTGTSNMMQAELDFLNDAMLSDLSEDIIIYNDMPIESLAANSDYVRKWLTGMTLLLRKGLHIDFIHDVKRSLPELFISIRSNIPLYMAGQISSWYLPSNQKTLFFHMIKSAGPAVLIGQAISEHHAEGRYSLLHGKEDLELYGKMAQRLLEKAATLLEVYRSEDADDFRALLAALMKEEANHNAAICAPPLFTIPEGILNGMLSRSGLSAEDRKRVKTFRQERRTAFEECLKKNKINLTVPFIPKEQFGSDPLQLQLSSLMIESPVSYTYEEYMMHIKATEDFAAAHSGLTLKVDPEPKYKNISYCMVGRHCVIISRNRHPAIHFVIRESKLVDAFWRYTPPTQR